MHALEEFLTVGAHRDGDAVVAEPATDASVRPRDVVGRLVGRLVVVLVELGFNLSDEVSSTMSVSIRAARQNDAPAPGA